MTRLNFSPAATVAAALTAALVAGCASTTAPPASMPPMVSMPVPPAGHSETPAGQAYEKSMMGMHEKMMRGIAYHDADTAFAAGMLPHHQGAVDMAKIQLQYGNDPELLRLAQEIIHAQEKEITQLQRWLKNNAKP